MFSYWEEQSFLHSDVIIVGGGILGLSTACSLKESHPTLSVTVLERGLLPTGASTKNAGFACFGSITELLSDEKILGDTRMLELIEKRWKGLNLLRKRLTDERIGYEAFGGYELLTEQESAAADHIERMNGLLYPLFGEKVFHERSSKISDFGFASSVVKKLISMPLEAQLHSGMMMRSLMQYASSLGVNIMTGADVRSVNSKGMSVEVMVNDSTVLTASKVAVCTNAFLPELFPEMKVTPGRGQVLITKPIANLQFKGTFHYDEGFYYFRNVGKRVLFGGGRNLDVETEATTEFSVNKKIIADLTEKLSTVILPNTPFEVEETWQGIMGFGETKIPFIKETEKNIVVALGCNGMGIALSSLLGKELSEQLHV